uniref:Uncharacterized protein n=1 Tax=Lotus japonicus TaxID=34305 RepID=I3T433_LOTJA|nr:unknown [Lotus japonicus]
MFGCGWAACSHWCLRLVLRSVDVRGRVWVPFMIDPVVVSSSLSEAALGLVPFIFVFISESSFYFSVLVGIYNTISNCCAQCARKYRRSSKSRMLRPIFENL